MLLLLSNDDGIDAPGLHALARAAGDVGDVQVVAPAGERSAQSHALTMHEPLRVEQRRPGWFACSGQPADCVYLGVHELCRARPDVVLSGINRGANIGDDVHYSGTVGAAEEAALLGVPALATSLVIEGRPSPEHHYETAAALSVRVVQQLLRAPLPPRVFLNLNVPDLPLDQIAGIAVARLGRRRYAPLVAANRDPRGKPYYWVGGEPLAHDDTEGTDGFWYQRGYATLTPLYPDLTHHESLAVLRSWDLSADGAPG